MSVGYTAIQAQAEAQMRLRRRAAPQRAGAGTDWRAWLHAKFPSYTTAPFAKHHEDAWAWLWAIERGVRPPPYILILARGGAKSTTAELGVVGVAARKSRRYALYVSDTQVQADKHVQTVGGMMEKAGFERELNKYGSSKGWRRNQIRTSDGFKVDAIGLDTAARGFKIDEDRPDFIILDDLDGKHDTPATTQKKIEALTMTILPAMATDGAVLGVQNIIHGNGIFARLADGRADFLSDRILSGPHPAIRGLEYAYTDGGYIITSGSPVWEGQSIEACQGFIKTWGLLAFLTECQHEVNKAGQFFEQWSEARHTCAPFEIPRDWPIWGALDYGFVHNTAFGLFTRNEGTVYLIGEHVQNKWTVGQHAIAIKALCARLGVNLPTQIVAGHDVFSNRGDSQGKTIADQYADYGIVLEKADIDRINGAAAVMERLGNASAGQPPTFKAFTTCPRTIATIPAMAHDPRRPEDVLKVDSDADGNGGDDPYDCLRYGCMVAPRRTVSGDI